MEREKELNLRSLSKWQALTRTYPHKNIQSLYSSLPPPPLSLLSFCAHATRSLVLFFICALRMNVIVVVFWMCVCVYGQLVMRWWWWRWWWCRLKSAEWHFTHFWRWMISNDRKKENNAKKFAVDLFVELHSNDKAIFVVILFDLSTTTTMAAAACATTNNNALRSVDVVDDCCRRRRHRFCCCCCCCYVKFFLISSVMAVRFFYLLLFLFLLRVYFSPKQIFSLSLVVGRWQR